MRRDRHPTDRLLGGKEHRLGILEKEAILEQVLATTRKPRLGFRFAWAGALATAALLIALAVSLRTPPIAEPEFGVRGGESSAVELTCHPGTSSPCRVGDALYFRMLSVRGPTHLAAFAKAASGEIVWFFPRTENAQSKPVAAGIVDEAPILPDTLGAGELTVHIVLSTTALNRAEVRKLYDEPNDARAEALRLERRLRVER